MAEADLPIKGEVKQGACHDPLAALPQPVTSHAISLSAHTALALPQRAQAWGCSSSGRDVGFHPLVLAIGELVCGGKAWGHVVKWISRWLNSSCCVPSPKQTVLN